MYRHWALVLGTVRENARTLETGVAPGGSAHRFGFAGEKNGRPETLACHQFKFPIVRI
jgi:hypothetical protein